MSASALMSLGARAMAANYAALQATGHNIANANVAGYSRQQVELSSSEGTFSGSGYFGNGVEVTTVTRAHDAFLTREAAGARSLAAADDARLKNLQLMERVFPTGEAGVGHASGQFLNAMADLAARPADVATRQVVLARAADVASRFTAAAGQLDVLQGGVNEELRVDVKQVNQLAQSVANLNQRIIDVRGLGQPPNDLLDERDRTIAEISKYLQVSTVGAEDGSMAVFIGGGQRLVLGTHAEQLVITQDPVDATRSALAIKQAAGVITINPQGLGGGAISGLLRFQNEDLVHGRATLGQLAAAFAGKMNEQQALGLDMRQPAGSGAALFSVGAPQALPAASNAKGPGGAYSASVSLATVDASQLQASEYDLRADPAGAPGVWQLTRKSDGLVRSVASGDVVDGFRISLSTPAPAANDRYLLQPVSGAAGSMARVLDDPRGVAAALAVATSTAAANTGTASVARLAVVSPGLNAGLTAGITFSNNTGAYDWELRDAGNALVSSGSGNWTAGAPIALNGFELELNGVPAAGDAFSVGKTTFPGGNNGNALAFLSLRDAKLVGREALAGGALAGGATLTDAYASALAGVGVRVQGAGTAAGMSATLAHQAEDVRAGKAGVNLDEEAARLIQYQQSYQAAAKMLQVAQSLFDTLLQVTGR